MASTVGSTIDYKASYASLLDDYRARTSLSAAAWQRGRLVLPGGETRTVTTYSPYPTLIRKGQGAHLTDLDGNHYVDLVNNYTSLVHGSAYGPATEAAVAVLRGGAIFRRSARVAVAPRGNADQPNRHGGAGSVHELGN
ncbi:aminotransferase class III-fold pyridoxal phosphate-dependent enzyme [Saccharopolyspora elongata]|uniref:Aminotransferase class III-fold pyridoxal phosphate-dependent enzyme n=1 Tax=Saccharopolyspora elongata TaxID=2530387 RepID=A0A4R4YCS6_9PSEU|nr:aminotransferase class III-fold pyridoxal phosphate-dependent enzyme [Saccharopolyspora elongata]